MADEKKTQLAAEEATLQAVQEEIGALSDRLRELRQHEAMTQGRIFSLKQEISTALEFDVNSKIDKLMAEIQRRDRALAELQAAYERAMADKVDMQEEVQKIQKLGDAAGRVQQTTNISSSRYELSGPAAASGSSQDPLAQAQVPLQNDFSMRGPRPDTVTSTDQLGEHTTASPLVEPLVVGERPVAQNSQSSRFSDWRPTSSRSSTRVTQAPGGSSAQISQIFG